MGNKSFYELFKIASVTTFFHSFIHSFSYVQTLGLVNDQPEQVEVEVLVFFLFYTEGRDLPSSEHLLHSVS